jgi:hypothetical protein
VTARRGDRDENVFDDSMVVDVHRHTGICHLVLRLGRA